MAQVASVNYDTKRVYLHADTVAGGFDAVAAYFEINALRAANAFGEQNRAPFLSAEGNIPKTATTFTPRYVLMNVGWRFVPHDTGASTSYNLDLMVEIISKEQLTDRDVFDRSGLACTVNIDPVYTPVEIRAINSGSGLSADQAAMLEALAKIHGLILGQPLTVTPTARSAGGIVQTVVESGSAVTVERTA